MYVAYYSTVRSALPVFTHLTLTSKVAAIIVSSKGTEKSSNLPEIAQLQVAETGFEPRKSGSRISVFSYYPRLFTNLKTNKQKM